LPIFQYLDYAGVAVFAASGALAASRKQLDIIGFLFLAGLTGLGGGTVRDLILGLSPVFWSVNHTYLGVCAIIAVIVYFTAFMLENRYLVLLWLDAAGLSAYCVLGAHIGLQAGAPPLTAVVTGIMTATAGGILRDIVSAEQSVLLRREIYITAALAGATAYILLDMAGLAPLFAAAIAMLLAMLIRGGALQFGWTLPGYRHRQGRSAS
jgi:uncharacterized membrane protein YeiH